MHSLNPRARVRTALDHQEPDRVPYGIGSSGSAIHDQTYFKLLDRLSLGAPVEPFRRGHGDNHYDDRVLEALNADVRHVFLNHYRASHFVREELGEGGLYDPFVDAWGVTNEAKEGMHIFTGEPLGGDISQADINNHTWPDPYGDSGLVENLRQRAEQLDQQGTYAIASRSPCSGIFEYCWLLRGLERFLIDMLTEPTLAACLIDRITENVMKYYDVLLGEVGEYVDIVETQDDYGTQQNTFFSPELFREFFKPARTRLNELIREKAPQARIYLHTCGSVREIIPDLIETGVEVLNPVQPLAAGMETGQLKSDFGAALTFYGAIDLQQALPGTPEQLREEVKQRVWDLAPGGGYVLAPANVIHRDVPLDNLFQLSEDLVAFGTYPIEAHAGS
jgi:uroporphyrinogen decarboxylase